MQDHETVEIRRLCEFIGQNRRLAVISGAGVSTASGIPDYRDRDGNWKNAQPVQFADFVGGEPTRQRYWARSFVGWQRFSAARPNAAHAALASLEAAGKVQCLITQNVDELHRRAGSRNVIDLHGVLSRVRCLDCDGTEPRHAWQSRLQAANPDWQANARSFRPDGDAELDADAILNFHVPHCLSCGGIVKPDVVFFGENVPRARVHAARDAIENSDALLVVGSSLMVFSGYRFARRAAELGKPIAIVNRGKTRADELAHIKVDDDCSTVLSRTATLCA